MTVVAFALGLLLGAAVGGLVVQFNRRTAVPVPAPKAAAKGRVRELQRSLVAVSRLTADDWAVAVPRINELVGGAIGVERVGVWLIDRTGTEALRLEDLYTSADRAHATGVVLAAKEYHRYFQALSSSRGFAVADVTDDSRTHELVGYFSEVHVTSTIDVPIRLEGVVVGVLCLEHVGPERAWRADEEEFAADVGDQLATMLALRRQREATASLRATEEKCALAFKNSPDSIAITRVSDTTLLEVNDGFTRLTGYSRAEAIGRKAFDLIYAVSADERARMLASLRAGRPIHDLETKTRRKDGTLFDCCLSVALFTVRGEECALSVTRDITVAKAQERALREANETLEARVAERTAELAEAKDRAESADRFKSAFLATMSHELRTPLNSVIGFTGLLLRGVAGPLNGEQAKQLGIVQAAARHLLSLVSDVLDLSKLEAGQLEVEAVPFDAAESVHRVADLVRPLASRKALSLTVEIGPGVGRVTGDRRRFEQILINLAGNAIKFTEHGGVTVAAAHAGGELTVAVADTGSGIRPEHLALLFEPFRQLDNGLTRKHEGTGLGLAICRKLARMLGGEIDAASEWGAGSTFRLRLPDRDPPAAPPRDDR